MWPKCNDFCRLGAGGRYTSCYDLCLGLFSIMTRRVTFYPTIENASCVRQSAGEQRSVIPDKVRPLIIFVIYSDLQLY